MNWRRFFRREEADAEQREELESYLDLTAQEYVERGMEPSAARAAAQRKLGNPTLIVEEVYRMNTVTFIEGALRDVHHALRMIRSSPGFSSAAILSLALGVGATTSIFTLAHAVLLKSLPVARPDELYRVGKEAHCCAIAGYSQEKEFSLVSYDLYKYLRDNTKGFVELAAFPAVDMLFGVRRAGNSEAAQTYGGEFVSGNYFAMFGIGAYAGRTLTARDDQAGAPPVALMSYRLWQGRYGSDPAVIGSTFNIDEKPFTVVGITPPGFFGDTLRGTPPDFFLPLNTEPYVESEADLNKYGQHCLELIGRISPGHHPPPIASEHPVKHNQ